MRLGHGRDSLRPDGLALLALVFGCACDSQGGGTDEGDHISIADLDQVEAQIASAEAAGWPDSGGAVVHRLPFASGVHMGISQGTSCGGHAGSLAGSVDFTILGNYESDNGIDAVSSAAGTVVYVVSSVTGYRRGSYGNYVIVRHPDATYTIYAHLAFGRVYVDVGQDVCAGQPIGLIGSTGESSGEHLHYEQRNVSDVRTTPLFEELDPVPSACTPCTTDSHESGCYLSANTYNATDCADGPVEVCNGIDDDADGSVDEGINCWTAVYRWRDTATGGLAWGVSDASPPAVVESGSWVLDGEEFVISNTGYLGTQPLYLCGTGLDHLLVTNTAPAVGAGYDCSTLLGHVWPVSGAPTGTAFGPPSNCYRFGGQNSGGGTKHLFSDGGDTLVGLTCEGVQFGVLGNGESQSWTDNPGGVGCPPP